MVFPVCVVLVLVVPVAVILVTLEVRKHHQAAGYESSPLMDGSYHIGLTSCGPVEGFATIHHDLYPLVNLMHLSAAGSP